MCQWNPGNRGDEQMAVRHADAFDSDITENQHDENRMERSTLAKEDQMQHVKNNLIS